MGMMESRDLSKVLILVADDEENLLLLLKDNLEEHGFQVVVAKNGEEAYKNSVSSKPDVIVLDVEMPKLNGWQVCERVRASAELKNVPILILSAYAQPEDIKKGIQLGANHYMTKPFKMNELIENVRRLIKR